MFFKYLGFSFSRYFTHAGQQEVNIGNGPPFFLVHAHELERRDEPVEHIFARGEAERLAHGHAHGGRDLDDNALAGVVDGAPRLADLIFHRDGAGSAHRRALAAAHALRLGELAVKGGHDLQIAAAIGKVQNAHTLHLLAHAHTVAAEDALVRVAQHRGRRAVDLVVLARIGEANFAHTELLGKLL